MNPTITLEEIYAPIDKDVQTVPAVILDLLSTSNELAGDVIRYFFSAKGKLLRPALALFGAAMGPNGRLDESRRQALLQLAASFEIFHAATLIHDDIIDASYVRRNLPTVNVKWGPQTAVLVGDYLHDRAMGAIFKNGDARIFARFLETAGIVCDGEIHELNETHNLDLKEDTYLEIIDKKTAALLACSLEAGGMFAGVTDSQALALRRFGRHFGLAFQIVDDCLDFTGNEHEFGKTLGADAAGGVFTLPVIRLFEVAEESEKKILRGIFGGQAEGRFQPLLDMIRNYKTVEYALERARDYSRQARTALAAFPESPARQSLDRLVDYVLERSR